jgi:hypothetical protein
MRKLIWSLTLLTALASTPAYAQSGEGSAELRLSGVANNDGAGLLGGVGLAYDWDLGEKFSVGAQATGDVSFQGDFGVVAGVVRAGPKLGKRSKIYALGGIATIPDYSDRGNVYPVAGVGIDLGIGSRLYAKAEYRLFPGSDNPDSEGNSGTLNQITFGFGIRF